MLSNQRYSESGNCVKNFQRHSGTRTGYALAMASKSLDKRANDTARAAVRRIVEEECGGNGSAAARVLGVSQSFLSEFVNGTRGAGSKLMRALAARDPSTALSLLNVADTRTERDAVSWAEFAARYPNGAAVYEQIRAALHPGVREDAIRVPRHLADAQRHARLAREEELRQHGEAAAPVLAQRSFGP